MNIGYLFQLAYEAVRARTSKTTWHTYAWHMKMFVEAWGDLPATELTRNQVGLFMSAQKEKGYAAGTLRHQLATLKMFFNWAIDEGFVVNNPASRLRMPRGRKRTQWLTLEDERQLKAAYEMQEGGALEFEVARFAILTGCRRGEQLHLRPYHIQGKFLEIPFEGKTGSRIIGLHPEGLEIAQRWIQISKKLDSPFVFWPEAFKNRFKYGEVYYGRVFKPRVEEIGLGHLQWRDLRRTFATRLVRAGVPILEVQKMLGHTNPQQTMTYCCVDANMLYESVLRLN